MLGQIHGNMSNDNQGLIFEGDEPSYSDRVILETFLNLRGYRKKIMDEYLTKRTRK